MRSSRPSAVDRMVRLTHEPIDPEAERRSIEDPSLGGVVVFAGEVRCVTDGAQTVRVHYSAYEEMALRQMEAIAGEAAARWRGKVALVHRLGDLLPGDIAVVTAAACPHRAEAFECCRFLIDRLKDEVPIWKREFGPAGDVWVEGEARMAGQGAGD